MSTCNVNTLLSDGKAFATLDARQQQVAIAQLLCDISASGGSPGGGGETKIIPDGTDPNGTETALEGIRYDSLGNFWAKTNDVSNDTGWERFITASAPALAPMTEMRLAANEPLTVARVALPASPEMPAMVLPPSRPNRLKRFMSAVKTCLLSFFGFLPLLLFLCVLNPLPANAGFPPSLLYNFATTNGPVALTNIIKSLITNSGGANFVLKAGDTMTGALVNNSGFYGHGTAIITPSGTFEVDIPNCADTFIFSTNGAGSGLLNVPYVTSGATITANLFSGSGASLTALNASSLASGTAGTARLGSGSATANALLHGDSTWSAVAAGDLPATVTTNNGTLSTSLLIGDGGRGVANTAVGAVPIDGNGTATTFAQVNALAPANILTNNESISVQVSNAWTFYQSPNLAGKTNYVALSGDLIQSSNALTANWAALTNGGLALTGGLLATNNSSLTLSNGHAYQFENTNNAFNLNIKFDGSTVATLNNAANWNVSSYTVAGGTVISSSKAFTGLSLQVSTTAEATNGFRSWRSNQVALYSVPLGSSPYSWVNTNSCNVFALLAGGTVSAITLNGTTLPAAFLTGSDTLPMQTNETLTITYTVAPTLLVKPF